MNKKGFVFIESVITIVVLTTALLLLYTSFSRILRKEKSRVNYDDVKYIYRTFYIRNELNQLNIGIPIRDLKNGVPLVTIGLDYQNLFAGKEERRTFFTNMVNDFEVDQIILLKESKINDFKQCSSSSTSSDCVLLYSSLDEKTIDYVKSLYIDVDCTNVLAIKYKTCSNESSCKDYYSWVGM